MATKPLRPHEGPVQEHARSLRELRARLGDPSLQTMAREGYSSAATLSAVQTGQTFPTWEATLAYLSGCGIAGPELEQWQERWLDVADLIGYRGARPTDSRPPARGPYPTCHEITTVAQFREGLRRILRWNGARSQAQFVRQAEQDGVLLARATLSDMLAKHKNDKLPSAASTRLYLTAGGLPFEHIEAWMAVHSTLKKPAQPAADAVGRRQDDRYIGKAPAQPILAWITISSTAPVLRPGPSTESQKETPPSRPALPPSRLAPLASRPVLSGDLPGSGLLAGRYRLVERLGAGGMSVVWRGFDEVLGRQVAIKVLPPSTSADPSFRRRLRAEAQAAARLTHPHITNVYDYGEATTVDGEPVPYIVMELVDGESLAAVLAKVRTLPWSIAIRIAAEVAAALASAHARGIVHRDVTPANVMLTPSGAKVVDFGISALIGENDTDPDGSLLGTPAYLAPERLEGGQVSPATDVYAVGLLIYRMLVGQLPWDVGTTTDLLRAHQYTEPKPLPPVEGLPGPIAALISRCVEKSPSDRVSSAEVARVLAEVLSSAPVLNHVESPMALGTGEETTILPRSNTNADYRGRHRRT